MQALVQVDGALLRTWRSRLALLRHGADKQQCSAALNRSQRSRKGSHGVPAEHI